MGRVSLTPRHSHSVLPGAPQTSFHLCGRLQPCAHCSALQHSSLAHTAFKTLYKIHLIFSLIELQFPAHLHYTVWESHFGFLRKFILKMRSLGDCSMGKSITACQRTGVWVPASTSHKCLQLQPPKKSSLNFQPLWALVHTLHTCTYVK